MMRIESRVVLSLRYYGEESVQRKEMLESSGDWRNLRLCRDETCCQSPGWDEASAQPPPQRQLPPLQVYEAKAEVNIICIKRRKQQM